MFNYEKDTIDWLNRAVALQEEQIKFLKKENETLREGLLELFIKACTKLSEEEKERFSDKLKGINESEVEA